jgi:hypothetical protein
MRQAGEGKETGALTGASAPEIPNPKLQIPKKLQAPNSKGSPRDLSFWFLVFLKIPWDLGFGIWDFRIS